VAVALRRSPPFRCSPSNRQAIEKTLLRDLLPPQISATILRYLQDFTANAAGLTAWGLALLVLTALLMIHTVDRVLNDIWKVAGPAQRAGAGARLLTLLTLGPLAVGASLSATSAVFALSGAPLSRASDLTRAVLDWLPLADRRPGLRRAVRAGCRTGGSTGTTR